MSNESKEQRRQYNAEWRKRYYSKPANRAKLKAQQRKYYNNNLTTISENNRQRYATTKKPRPATAYVPPRQDWSREYYQKNKERIKLRRATGMKCAFEVINDREKKKAEKMRASESAKNAV